MSCRHGHAERHVPAAGVNWALKRAHPSSPLPPSRTAHSPPLPRISQARRLETQLYQRAQDQRTIEFAQKQAHMAMSQVRALEEHHVNQEARIGQGAKSLQTLQQQMRETAQEHQRVIDACEALHKDVAQLRSRLLQTNPAALEGCALSCDQCPSIHSLRSKAAELEATMLETERSALQQIGATPSTPIAMSHDCNPLHDLSAVADYASKCSPGASPPDSDDGKEGGKNEDSAMTKPQPIPMSKSVSAIGGGSSMELA